MTIYPQDRFALFIDGSNLFTAAKGLDFDIDYKRVLEYFSAQGRMIRAFYYTALMEDQEYSPIRPLVDWLDYNGYTMVTKPTKEFIDPSGRRKIKGNLDIELAVDVLQMSEYLDHAVIFSGDGDFRRLRAYPAIGGPGRRRRSHARRRIRPAGGDRLTVVEDSKVQSRGACRFAPRVIPRAGP